MSSVISPAASASKTTAASDARRRRPSTKRTVRPKRRATSSGVAPVSMMLANACASSAGFIFSVWKFSARLASRTCVSSPSKTRHMMGNVRDRCLSAARASKALRRRSPASTSNCPFLPSRTTRFCKRPCAAMLALSSASAAGSERLRTFRGEATSLFSGIDLIMGFLRKFEPTHRHSAARARPLRVPSPLRWGRRSAISPHCAKQPAYFYKILETFIYWKYWEFHDGFGKRDFSSRS